MNDYPELNMFVQARRLLVLDNDIVGDLMVIVSPFDERRTEEQNVDAVRATYLHVPGDQTSCCLACGEADGKGFGIVVFRPTRRKNSVQLTEAYCLGIAACTGQPGYVKWDCNDAAYFIPLNGPKTKLEPWNKTLARLEEWCQYLKPEFKIQGEWNRQASYIRMRHAKLKTQSRQ